MTREIHSTEIENLITYVEQNIYNNDLDDLFKKVQECIGKYPDSPEPQNLLGLLNIEAKDRKKALIHFRIALTLDPDYEPAKQNLDIFSCSTKHNKGVFRSQSVTHTSTSRFKLRFGSNGIGYITKNS